MSDIVKGAVRDINTIWSRLFDHRAFLNGEIRFTLHEFEETRSDKEIESLFSLLEKITDIKGTQIDRTKQAVNLVLPQANLNLAKALSICDQLGDLELKYKQDTVLELCRDDRKNQWEKFVDDMSFNCKRIDNTFEEKEEELQEFYNDLERKLHLALS